MNDIQVTIRTRATGHETVAIPFDQLPEFIDRKLAEGRIVIAESGSESVIVRIGREILDFFRGRRTTAAKQGKPIEKEEVTVLNPMAGGAGEGEEAADNPALVGAVLQAVLSARTGSGKGISGQIGSPNTTYAEARTAHPAHLPLDAMAEMRAWRALVVTEGEAAVAPLLHGGAITVRSALWPNVLYLVKTNGIVVLREGRVENTLCLQLLDGAPIWDAVANRLQLLRAGERGELQVWAMANT